MTISVSSRDPPVIQHGSRWSRNDENFKMSVNRFKMVMN
jgi:hypothetical protein